MRFPFSGKSDIFISPLNGRKIARTTGNKLYTEFPLQEKPKTEKKNNIKSLFIKRAKRTINIGT